MNFLLKTTILLCLFCETIKAIVLNQTLLVNKYGYSIESVIIDLSELSISSIELNTFDKFNKVQVLYLHNNKLSSIKSDVFSGLLSLREIWLETNNLVAIDKNVFNNLHRLDLVCLTDNPISVLYPSQVESLCAEPLKCKVKINESCKKIETSNNFKLKTHIVFLK